VFLGYALTLSPTVFLLSNSYESCFRMNCFSVAHTGLDAVGNSWPWPVYSDAKQTPPAITETSRAGDTHWRLNALGDKINISGKRERLHETTKTWG